MSIQIPLKIKTNYVAGQHPLPSEISVGELVINSADGSLWTKKNDDTITSVTGGGSVGGIQSVNGYTTPTVVLAPSDLGLGNVNNTSDANKPISTATQAALSANQASISVVQTNLSSTQATVTSLQSAVLSKISDAPNDSNYYGRSGGNWAQISWTNLQNKPAVIAAGSTQSIAQQAIGIYVSQTAPIGATEGAVWIKG